MTIEAPGPDTPVILPCGPPVSKLERRTTGTRFGGQQGGSMSCHGGQRGRASYALKQHGTLKVPIAERFPQHPPILPDSAAQRDDVGYGDARKFLIEGPGVIELQAKRPVAKRARGTQQLLEVSGGAAAGQTGLNDVVPCGLMDIRHIPSPLNRSRTR